MPGKRPRSAGVRHPARKALLLGIATLLALGLVAAGIVVERYRAQLGTH